MNKKIPGIRDDESLVPGTFFVPENSQHTINTLEDAQTHIQSLWFNMNQQAHRIRELEEVLDIWNSPWWKIVLFVIDGWPLRRVVSRPQWRPWRRWWTS